MAYIDNFTLAADATFQKKVRMASVVASNAVLAGGTPSTAQMALAKQILQDSGTFTPLVAQMIQSDVNIAASAPTGNSLTDAQIQTAVNTYLSNFTR